MATWQMRRATQMPYRVLEGGKRVEKGGPHPRKLMRFGLRAIESYAALALKTGASMHRAVVLTTLVVLLLAVAGVSAAQDSGIFAGGAHSDNPPGSTTQERTSFEATVAEDTMAEDTMKSALPGASSEPKGGRDASEPKVVSEPTVGETEKPTAAAPGEQTLTPSSNNVGKSATGGRGVGKAALVGKAPNIGNPPDEVGHPANGKPEGRGNQAEHGRGGQQKVTLCHKNKTLTVGAPALGAHLRHGDTRGACQTEGSGSELSGETMKPEAAKNGEGGGRGGQDKVILCHKNKTLTVGAQAQAAHLRHGDSLGACRGPG
jgi:hypothetical protein